MSRPAFFACWNAWRGVGRVAGAVEREPVVELHDRVRRAHAARAARWRSPRLRPPGANACRIGRRVLRRHARDDVRLPAAACTAGRRLGRVLARGEDDPDDDRRGGDRGDRGNDSRTRSGRRHGANVAGMQTGCRLPFQADMTTYRELLQQHQVRDLRGRRRARRRRARRRSLDRRARGGRVAGRPSSRRRPRAARIPRVADREGRPRQGRRRSSSTAPPRTARRSPRRRWRSSATRTSHSLAGGFTDWKRNGYEIVLPRTLSPETAHALLASPADPRDRRGGAAEAARQRILLIGAGGLGSPASLYLAAAGIGTLGIVDADIVDETNLQRQIAHSLDTLGTPKVDSAKRAIEALNPDVDVVTYRERLTSENIDRILDDGWDLIVDGADNFPTRYLVNDASVWRGIPGRPRLDLPLRGPGHGVQAARRAVLPLPLPRAAAAGARAVVRRGRRARRAAGHRRLAADQRGDQARGRDRRAADRPAAALRRALRPSSARCGSSATPIAPSAATTRRSPSTSTTSSSARDERCVRVPPVLRSEAGGAREVEADGATVRELIEDLARRLPGARHARLRRRRAAVVRERLRRRRGRAHARRPRHSGPRTARR